MLLNPECVPCIISLAIKAFKLHNTNEAITKEYVRNNVLKNPAIKGDNWEVTSPEVIENILIDIANLTNASDPFKVLKSDLNDKSQQNYAWIHDEISNSTEPLFWATNLAIIGNSMDAMKYQEPNDIKQLVLDGMENPISRETFSVFHEKLRGASKILYLADNCGEIVFDKIFIEILKRIYKIDIIFVVRNQPTLNDATVFEAKEVGIDNMTLLIDNGINGPLPGTIIRRCSNDTKKYIKDVDIIISKGGGNFDTFSEEQNLNKDVFFLLMSKCIPYCNQFQIEINKPVLAYFRL